MLRSKTLLAFVLAYEKNKFLKKKNNNQNTISRSISRERNLMAKDKWLISFKKHIFKLSPHFSQPLSSNPHNTTPMRQQKMNEMRTVNEWRKTPWHQVLWFPWMDTEDQKISVNRYVSPLPGWKIHRMQQTFPDPPLKGKEASQHEECD